MRKLKTYLWLLSLSCAIIGCTNEEAILLENNNSDTETETVEESVEDDEDLETTSNENTTPVKVATTLIANDLAPHPMQDVAKPAYLETIVDPSFGTVIRRISNAGTGGVIKPMYSTIQA